MLLNNEKCEIRPTIIDLNPAELKYYLYIVTLNKFNWSCNTFTEISKRICTPNETENVDLNVLSVFKQLASNPEPLSF